MQRNLIAIFCYLFFSAGCGDAEGQPAIAEKPNAAPSIASEAGVGDWPRWRGVRFDGISRERDWKSQWEDDDEPEQLWKTNIGVGFSSLAVQGDRLYSMGHSGGELVEGVHLGGDDTVFCLNADTGETIWKHSYPCARVNNLHEGGPAATPTLHAGLVFTLSKEGHLLCLDAAGGDVLWKRELQQDLETKMPEWGFSSSPLVWKNLVIVDGGRLAAYEIKSGELVWKTKPYRAGYGSAAPFQHNGDELIAALNNDALIVVRAADGELVAETPWKTDFATTSATPIIKDDTIFVSTGYGTGCALFRLEDGELTEIYANKKMRNHMNNSVLWDGYLYGFDGNSHNARTVSIKCIDYATGEEKWGERGLGCGSLMMSDGKLMLLSDRGELVIAAATPEEFKPACRTKILDGKCWTVPVLANKRIFARDAGGELVCIDVSK
jgi:outer membrane protein assembly factor BamB